MKTPEIISEGTCHSAIDLGSFDNITGYSFLHPKLNVEIKGKYFCGEILSTTGAELSVQSLPPGAEAGFIHKHHKHEELYIFIKGKGQFQVDGNIFDVSEGSMVRIAPEGARSYRNTSDQPLVFICIQTQADSIDSHYIEEGYRVPVAVSWQNR